MRIAAALTLAALGASACLLTHNVLGEQGAKTKGSSAESKDAPPGPVITVEAVYPGANARDVAENVVTPIEQEVNGVENMIYMLSKCTNDGQMILDVRFKPGTDLNMAQVLVQNRVSVAEAKLPEEVKRIGLTVRKKPAGALMIVSLSSPDGRYDNRYLSNYATVQYKDELVRLPGVGEVAVASGAGFGVRVWLDPEKLAARDLTANEVIRVMRKQKMDVEAGQIGKPPKGKKNPLLDVKDLGRLVDPDGLERLIVKTSPDGRVVRLKDVGRVEFEHTGSSEPVRLSGEPVVILCVYSLPLAQPRKVSEAVQETLKRLRDKNPKGLKVEVAFDFTANLASPGKADTPVYLLLEPVLPREEPRRFNMYTGDTRTGGFLKRCEALLRKVDGVKDVLVSAENLFEFNPDKPCILVRLTPAAQRAKDREQIKRAIRAQLETLNEGTLRLRDLAGLSPFPRCGYPVDLAIHGPEADSVRKLAEKLADRLRQGKKLTDLAISQGNAPAPYLQIEIDRAAMAKNGVRATDVFDALQIAHGGGYVGDFNRFGRTWQVNVAVGPGAGKQADDLKKIKIRNNKGQMVPLADFAKLRAVKGVALIERFNGQPMARITANPAAEVSLAEIRTLCESAASEARKALRLPPKYQLTWFQELPMAR